MSLFIFTTLLVSNVKEADSNVFQSLVVPLKDNVLTRTKFQEVATEMHSAKKVF